MRIVLFLLAAGFMVFAYLEMQKSQKSGSELETLKVELATVKEQAEKAEAQVTELKKTAEAQAKELKGKAKELEAKADGTERQLLNAMAEVKNKEQLATTLESSREEIQKHVTEKTALRDQLSAKESALMELKDKLSFTESQLAASNAEIERLKRASAAPAIGAGTSLDKRTR